MNLPGVSKGKIDHRIFDRGRYDQILIKLIEHTRRYLTAKSMAAYLLYTIKYSGSGKILFLSNEARPEYLRCCVLIGLKELLRERVVDFPKIEHIYKSYLGDTKKLYGKGFSYTKIVEDFSIDRDNIEQRIRNKEFDLIVYGPVHKGLPFHELVCQIYDSNKILYLCGEDTHIYNGVNYRCQYVNLTHLFLREFEPNLEIYPLAELQ